MDDDESGEDYGEYQTSFTGCICEHEPDEHGWGSCGVGECPCEGGWEE